MTNQKPIDILKSGVDIWNEWRMGNLDLGADFNHIDFGNMDLGGVNFLGADLRWTKFDGANFFRINRAERYVGGGLLTFADLSRASIANTNLSDSNLIDAKLNQTMLKNVNLENANLSGAEFVHATLHQVNLRGANLTDVKFVKTEFDDVDMSQSQMGLTTFGWTDLSSVKGLDNIIHRSNSGIDIPTIQRSAGNISKKFLQGLGVPDEIIEYALKPIKFYSCFISYSSKDESFAKHLYDDLQNNGVRTWYFPEDAKWGATLWSEIDRSINIHDKLVIVCSVNSLQSGPVLREIDRALNREDREGKNILFPIRIDDYIFDGWEHERKADILKKVVGDFHEWNTDIIKYNAAFEKLLRGLKAA